jgi:hypothetical protein
MEDGASTTGSNGGKESRIMIPPLLPPFFFIDRTGLHRIGGGGGGLTGKETLLCIAVSLAIAFVFFWATGMWDIFCGVPGCNPFTDVWE